MTTGGRGMDAQHARNALRAALHHVYERKGKAVEHQQHGRHQQSQAVRLHNGKILGRDLAKDYVKVAHGQKAKREAGGMQIRRVAGRDERPESRQNRAIQGILARPPQAQTRQGDSNLSKAEQSFWVGEQLERRAGGDAVSGGQFFEPRPAYGDQGHLGRCEKRVHRHNGGEHNESKCHQRRSLQCAVVPFSNEPRGTTEPSAAAPGESSDSAEQARAPSVHRAGESPPRGPVSQALFSTPLLKALNLSIAVLLAALTAAAYWFGWRTLPETSGTI